MDAHNNKEIEVEPRIFFREEAKRYQLIFEQIPIGIIHFDEKGTIFDCNDRSAQILTVSKENLIGCNIFEFVKEGPQKSAIEDSIRKGKGFFEGPHSVQPNSVIRAIFKRIDTPRKSLGVLGVFDLR